MEDCTSQAQQIFQFNLARLPAKLVQVYNDLKTQVGSLNDSAQTRIVVLGYPGLVSGTDCPRSRLVYQGQTLLELSEYEQQLIVQEGIQLNATIACAAEKAGLTFVSVAEHFGGHEVCASLDPNDEWIAGLPDLDFFRLKPGETFVRLRGLFHPNGRGQEEYAQRLEHVQRCR